jgi:hypothetical protein
LKARIAVGSREDAIALGREHVRERGAHGQFIFNY